MHCYYLIENCRISVTLLTRKYDSSALMFFTDYVPSTREGNVFAGVYLSTAEGGRGNRGVEGVGTLSR